MSMLWQSLALNIASLALFVWLWLRLDQRLTSMPGWVRDSAMGVAMGLAGVASILTATEIAPGVLFDLRAVPVVVAGYFGGPVGALIAGGLCAGYRSGLGGIGAGPAMLGIAFAGLLGVFGNQFKGGTPTAMNAGVLALGTAALPYATALLTNSLADRPSWDLLMPLALARGAGTLVVLWVVTQDQWQARQQLILHSALSQVPEYFFVKDRDLRFVATNANVAHYHGRTTLKELIGKTDHDLTARERADRLARNELALMARPGPPFRERERMKGPDGSDRWFDTVKSPLIAQNGEILGLVGITRDVTKQRELEAELREGRDLFAFLLEEMSVGVALIDRHGVLLFSNARYKSAFPLTAHLRVPGTHIRDILVASMETGEQLGIEAGAAWVDEVVAQLVEETDQEVPLCDGSWVHIRTRPTAHGSALVIVSDVTAMKGSEKQLLRATDQLTKIATVDPVAGVLTRRAFDAKLRAELPKSETMGKPISLLMIDVDHFKFFNDTYGHIAGDACLGRIGRCLQTSVRAGDSVGRYGGEEFAVLLPETASEEALEIATRFARHLSEVGEPHAHSQTGFVTTSVGVATYNAEEFGRTRAELIKRADDALYTSKAKGRNLISVWESDDAGLVWVASAS